MFSATSARLEHVLVSVYDPPVTSDDADTARHCLVEQDGHKLVVTMNRPEARNALSGEMLAIMSDAWDRVNDDPEIRVCILTGAGGYFCAGMDLKAADKKPPSGELRVRRVRPDGHQAAAQGVPADQAADRRRRGAGDRRRHRDPAGHRHPGRRRVGEVRRLRGAGGASTRWAAPRCGWSAQIPYTVAADLLLTGRHILAPEAKELGLIGHVVPDGQALAKAHEIADLVAANGPLAVQAILKTMRDSEGKHEDDCWADDARVGAAVFSSEDAKEGPRAFSEKRPARSSRGKALARL